MLKKFNYSGVENRAVRDIKILIKDFRRFWPEDAGAIEAEFIDSLMAISKKDRSVFTFQRFLDSVNQLNTRMVKNVQLTKEPVIIGIAHAATLAVNRLVDFMKISTSHSEIAQETKKALRELTQDIKADGQNIYIPFYKLARQAIDAEKSNSPKQWRVFLQGVKRLLSGNYQAEDIVTTFKLAKDILITGQQKPGAFNNQMLSQAAAFMPLSLFIKRSPVIMADAWQESRKFIQPLHMTLRTHAVTIYDVTQDSASWLSQMFTRAPAPAVAHAKVA